MSRVGRFLGAAFLPLLAVAALLRGIYELGCAFARRFKGTVPDDLDDVLRAEIDGEGEAFAADLLSCGCPQTMPVTAECPSCGWKSCLAHAGATHLCERDPVIEAFNTNPRNPLSLDQRLDVLGAALVEGIYEYLESAQ